MAVSRGMMCCALCFYMIILVAIYREINKGNVKIRGLGYFNDLMGYNDSLEESDFRTTVRFRHNTKIMTGFVNEYMVCKTSVELLMDSRIL